jgi:hypothetical protein
VNRLADRRLHPAERSRRGGKAAGVGDGDQNAPLVERERIKSQGWPPRSITSTDGIYHNLADCHDA